MMPRAFAQRAALRNISGSTGRELLVAKGLAAAVAPHPALVVAQVRQAFQAASQAPRRVQHLCSSREDRTGSNTALRISMYSSMFTCSLRLRGAMLQYCTGTDMPSKWVGQVPTGSSITGAGEAAANSTCTHDDAVARYCCGRTCYWPPGMHVAVEQLNNSS